MHSWIHQLCSLTWGLRKFITPCSDFHNLTVTSRTVVLQEGLQNNSINNDCRLIHVLMENRGFFGWFLYTETLCSMLHCHLRQRRSRAWLTVDSILSLCDGQVQVTCLWYTPNLTFGNLGEAHIDPGLKS